MRRITIRLDVALETDRDMPARDIAAAIVEEVEMLLPSVAVPYHGVPAMEWPTARLTKVSVAGLDEQLPVSTDGGV